MKQAAKLFVNLELNDLEKNKPNRNITAEFINLFSQAIEELQHLGYKKEAQDLHSIFVKTAFQQINDGTPQIIL